jgi:S-DNA-T family DNA segregation ATPase FtsK/SpoIIIE
MAFVTPFLLIGYGIILLVGFRPGSKVKMMVFTGIIFVMLCILFAGKYLDGEGAVTGGGGFAAIYDGSVAGECGGIVGTYLAMAIVKLIGKAGLYIVAVASIIVCGILAVNTPMSEYARRVNEKRVSARERRAEKFAAAETPEATEAASPQISIEEIEKNPGKRPRIIDMDTGEAALAERDRPEDKESPAGGFFPGFITKFIGLKQKDTEPEPEPAPVKISDIPGTKNLSEGQKHILRTMMEDDRYGDRDSHDRSDEGFGLDAGTGVAPDPVPGTYANPVFRPVKPPQEEPFTLTDAFGEEASAEALALRTPRKPKNKGLAGDKMSFMSPPDDSYYEFPSVSLLSKGARMRTQSEASLNSNAAKLEQSLRDFRVEAKVANVTVGPTVTRYEVEPDVGVKIVSIKSLEPDLARSLEVKSVRVVPMPGTSLIGIEAYNSAANTIALRDIIDSKEFTEDPSKIAVALGKNISGERIVTDLKKMPHLLIAGTTGSGKSVCINCLLISILFRAKPSEVKLMLIDPKQVELKTYEDIPHLLVPVVTNPERAAMALGYAVTLMDERYRKFSEAGVRNMENYNELVAKQGKLEEVLPQIVIVIDELSDLMAVASAKVQESISRLAAMARAAGMHLIVATQQPLASILTSVIKANIPSRIAFAVQSGSSSRVILDKPGAERLLGNGDMLFSPVGSREPMRIQGAFVSEKEVMKVCDFIKKQLDPEYSDDIIRSVVTGPTPSLVADEDELFMDAVEMVAQSKQASVSMIQRRFRIGYNRSARLVDDMEKRGIVAPSDGTNKPRRLIMSEQEIEDFLKGAESAGVPFAGVHEVGQGQDGVEQSTMGRYESAPSQTYGDEYGPAPGRGEDGYELEPKPGREGGYANAGEPSFGYSSYPDSSSTDFDYSDFEHPNVSDDE